MAKDRMPVWQSSMKWTSDVLADGARWQKAVVYLVLLLLLGAFIALLAWRFAGGGEGTADDAMGHLLLR